MSATATQTNRFPQRITLRVPAGLAAAIDAAARQRLTQPSEYARRALLRALRTDGVRLGPDGRVETTAQAELTP